MNATIGLTAEEFVTRSDNRPAELVLGTVQHLQGLTLRHGSICARLVGSLGRYLDRHDCVHAMSNHPFVLTRREPDTVRGRTSVSSVTNGCLAVTSPRDW